MFASHMIFEGLYDEDWDRVSVHIAGLLYALDCRGVLKLHSNKKSMNISIQVPSRTSEAVVGWLSERLNIIFRQITPCVNWCPFQPGISVLFPRGEGNFNIPRNIRFENGEMFV